MFSEQCSLYNVYPQVNTRNNGSITNIIFELCNNFVKTIYICWWNVTCSVGGKYKMLALTSILEHA